MKKIAILGTVALLFGCSAATVADDHKTSTITKYESVTTPGAMSSIIKAAHYNTMLEHQAKIARQARLDKIEKEKALKLNRQALSQKVSELHDYVGNTWYVFSGSSPSGWDCSGLTRWFYGELGIEIPHSASKQGKTVGWHVSEPQIGDIVAFSHLNSNKYYHVGIYIGNNDIIHAGFKPGTKTEVISLDSAAFSKSQTTFVRVIEN